jgi:hypothetical protein
VFQRPDHRNVVFGNPGHVRDHSVTPFDEFVKQVGKAVGLLGQLSVGQRLALAVFAGVVERHAGGRRRVCRLSRGRYSIVPVRPSRRR